MESFTGQIMSAYNFSIISDTMTKIVTFKWPKIQITIPLTTLETREATI